MNGFSILMLIFATCVCLTGIYMYKGHKIGLLTERPAFKDLTKNEWTNIGKWTMILSIFMLIIAIIVYIFDI